MNIETKSVIRSEDIDHYVKFGWEHTEDTRVRFGRSSHIEHVLARDKDMPNYRLISALEKKYFSYKSQLRTYEPMEGFICVLLFFMFIIPFIIYFAYKKTQKGIIEAKNEELHKEMNKILAEVKPLL